MTTLLASGTASGENAISWAQGPVSYVGFYILTPPTDMVKMSAGDPYRAFKLGWFALGTSLDPGDGGGARGWYGSIQYIDYSRFIYRPQADLNQYVALKYLVFAGGSLHYVVVGP